MTTTGFTHQRGAQTATGYIQVPRAADVALRRLLPPGIVGSRHRRYLALRPFYVNGPAYGGLIGNIIDASRFIRLHLNDGQIDGQRVLSAETTRAMRKIDEPGKPFDHGLGWFRRANNVPGDWVEHFGAGAGFWNVMRLYPTRERGIAVMTNSTRSYNFEPLFELLNATVWR
jgi:CubicO group peptidase (beta-lactamase class C family)